MEIAGIAYQTMLLIVSISFHLSAPLPEAESHAAALMEMGNGPPAAKVYPAPAEAPQQGMIDPEEIVNLRWAASLLVTGQFLTHLIFKHRQLEPRRPVFREETLLVKKKHPQEIRS